MTRSTLKSSTGAEVVVSRGASAEVTGTFYDLDDVTLAKASIQSLSATIMDPATGRYLNDRKDQDILDVNGGTLAADGTLTLYLQPADLDACVSSLHERGILYLTLEWGWTNAESVSLVGAEQFEILVLGSP